ncbi:hypothetical protein PFBG_05296 [Plasmodium falciparum 7G8]|uniref:Uncharacterized protein n=1 Tax=Plasmodium falciparum (isolate 7G8) TaxID=57266 RepID=W7F7S6_PLAF8|nr:hypothetical protein PFBG_05296 [Plasmodium falciparum 7G8]
MRHGEKILYEKFFITQNERIFYIYILYWKFMYILHKIIFTLNIVMDKKICYIFLLCNNKIYNECSKDIFCTIVYMCNF